MIKRKKKEKRSEKKIKSNSQLGAPDGCGLRKFSDFCDLISFSVKS
jgi:hypothetical protein